VVSKSVPGKEGIPQDIEQLEEDGLTASPEPVTVPPPQPRKRRNRRKAKAQASEKATSKKTRPFFLRFWVLLPLTLGLTALAGGIVLERERQALIRELPNPDLVLTYARPETLTIKAADGMILQKIGPITRDPLKLEKMPKLLVEAFIASEDRRFYQHKGVDYQAIIRALKTNLQAGEVVEGGSTITQQLARIVFLDQDQSFKRKIREALLAQKIESEISKSEILERYLNLVYLGSGAYGVADAAWIYFSKSVDQLTLAEMATIAGLPPAPSVYSPLIDPQLAIKRRNIVLGWMLAEDYITPAEAKAASQEPLEVNPSLPKYYKSLSPYFTIFVQKELAVDISPEDLKKGGLVLETTLNTTWQKIAEENLLEVVDQDGYYENFSQAALVVIDPRTGGIKAMVGGTDFGVSQFNRVTQAQRQPGSTFKTFVYTTAISAGFSPYRTYEDAPITIEGYTPKNYGGRFSGTVSMLDALISSINIVSLKTLLDLGFNPVIQMANHMGIQSELQSTYSLALGASEVNLLELTSAYGTLANKGLYAKPHGISRVLDAEGNVLYDAKSVSATKAVDPDSAAIMTWMLTNVVNRGTGRPAQLDRPVAGKTGTSESARDLWFVGFIPQLVAGVWLGNDDNQPTSGSSGTAAYLWGKVMEEITEKIPVENFPSLPQVENRKPVVKVEPIKPSRVAYGASSDVGEAFEAPESEWSGGGGRSYQDIPETVPDKPAPESGDPDSVEFGDPIPADSGTEPPPPESSGDPVETDPPPEIPVTPEAPEVPVETLPIESSEPPPPPPPPPPPLEFPASSQ
jgi:penicillin-binding protein 1A